ncbi:MAG: helix-turn-helix domain-containing protein [Micromonosporaceae bacterium]
MVNRGPEPLRIPDDFWLRQSTQTALHTRDVGALFRLLKRCVGASQTRIGIAVGMEQGYVSKVMAGRRSITAIDVLERIADGCAMPDQSRMRLGLAPAQERRWPSSAPDSDTDLGRHQDAPDTGVVQDLCSRSDASAMQAFRAADRKVGGGHLYPTVVQYLHTEVAPRLFGDGSRHHRHPFTGAAALTEMAGWMAHDAGKDRAAEVHFNRAFQLARVGGDRQLGIHVLASRSHLAVHLRRPTVAVRLAEAGRTALKPGPSQPELEARLLAMQARGLAALQRSRECVRLLIQAETALGGVSAEKRSPWISGFDEASLASEAARCMHQLGDLSEAQRQAERIIELRPAERARSRALGQLILAMVLVGQGHPDEACAVAEDVLDTTQSLGSYPVIRQLLEMRPLLGPHGADVTVANFLARLDDVLRRRIWLSHWLPEDWRGQYARHQEGM